MTELILALDVPGREEALRLLDRLPALRWVKLGSVLMTAEGPPLVRELLGRGLRIFLDLKWHDIPNTVSGAVRSARELGVHLVTVHASGGPEMMRSAARAAGESLAVVGVTVLTSTGTQAASVDAEVERLTSSAVESGLSGVVCSPLEIERVRPLVGAGRLIVVPGIRRPGDPLGDQARVAGPAEAVRRGATHLVVGRPIRESADPTATLDEFLAVI